MANQSIEEEKKYYEILYRGTSGGYYKIRGYYTKEELNRTIDFECGSTIQAKLIGIEDEEFINKSNNEI